MSTWSLKGKSILVIDDFAGMRSMLRTMLSAYQADDITEATNGVDAVEKMSNKTYDIILCDYNLGDGKDGQQVLEEAKAFGLIPYSTVYVMTTAENTSEMVMGAVEYQPDDYLSKPFTKEVLITRLKTLVEKKSELRPIANAVALHDYETAYALCSTLLEGKSKNRSDILKIQSDIALKMGAHDKAEEIFSSVLRERDLPWAQLGLGKVKYLEGKLDEAREILEALIKDNNNYVFAHDCLAQVYKKLGDPKKSQAILQEAVDKSPKAILRQKELANLSFENADYETSESAFKRVIRMGKHSCYRGPEDYTGLAKTYIKKGSTIDAVRSLSNMRTEFKTAGPPARTKSLVSEVIIYHDLGKIDEAKKSITEIMKNFNNNSEHLSSGDAIELAKICYKLGMNDEGDILVQHVVRNNHDDKDMLDNLEAMLNGSGIDRQFSELIANTRDEVIALNNKGVELATQGKIEDSIDLFEKAASAMPENAIVNLNAAQSLIMYMTKHAASDKMLDQAMKYLAKIKIAGKPSEKHQKLLSLCRKLQNGLPVRQ
jgi:CheY-like chemotaxis protein